MIIAIVDGQGGGIGKSLIEKIKASITWEYEIIALGTNTTATSVMLRAGADYGASGENAIIYNAPRVNVIIGALGIVSANSFHGEFSPKMAGAIGESDIIKILIPSNRCNLYVAGAKDTLLAEYIDDAVALLDSLYKAKEI